VVEQASPRVRYQKLRPEGALLQLAQKIALPRVPCVTARSFPFFFTYSMIIGFLVLELGTGFQIAASRILISSFQK
jgi:hypothetical protein